MPVTSPQIKQGKKNREDFISYLASLLPDSQVPNPPTFGLDVPFAPSTYQDAGRGVLDMLVPQPEDTLIPVGLPKVKPLALEKGMSGEPGYVYHATNEERLFDIAKDKLRTYKPWEFTDQDMWPDGSIKKRSYFAKNPEHIWQFAPEEGKPVILRTKLTKDFKDEWSGGDTYTEKLIPPKKLEYLGEDKNWHSLLKLLTED